MGYRIAQLCVYGLLAVSVGRVLGEEPVGAVSRPGTNEAIVWVHVDGRLMSVNGEPDVPRGVFGVHAMDITPANRADLGIECTRGIFFNPSSSSLAIDGSGRVKDAYRGLITIDCQGDRYAPANVLTDTNYVAHFQRLGREYGERCKAAGWPGIVEFWNEPYLNWADRSRRNYDNKFYDETLAVDGGAVTIKGWSTPLTHLRWKRLWPAYEVTVTPRKGPDSGKEIRERRLAWGVPVPSGLKAGDTFTGKESWYWLDKTERTYTVVEEWHVHDPTQVAWWSGRQNLDFYLWMFLPFARAVKEANPEVKVIGGWDFNLDARDWAVWRELYVPVIDQSIQWLDGITDHHYGVETRHVTAWYEVAVAYTVSKHGKAIKGYNTECGGSLDPAVHGVPAQAEGQANTLQQHAAQATYALRDMLELLYHAPDKVGSRTAHHAQNEPGVLQVLRMLRDVRGPMMRVVPSASGLWPVACLNSNRLVQVVFNDRLKGVPVQFDVAAPAGSAFAGGRWEWLAADSQTQSLVIATEPVAATGSVFRAVRDVGGHQAMKLVLAVEGPIAPARVARSQSFAREGVLLPVLTNRPTRVTLALDAGRLVRAEAAWLKLVVEKNSDGEAALTVNGQAVPLPAGFRWTSRLPLDKGLLREENTLEFSCSGGGTADGYQIDVVSVELDVP
jgi:hypothetical protein